MVSYKYCMAAIRYKKLQELRHAYNIKGITARLRLPYDNTNDIIIICPHYRDDYNAYNILLF